MPIDDDRGHIRTTVLRAATLVGVSTWLAWLVPLGAWAGLYVWPLLALAAGYATGSSPAVAGWAAALAAGAAGRGAEAAVLVAIGPSAAVWVHRHELVRRRGSDGGRRTAATIGLSVLDTADLV